MSKTPTLLFYGLAGMGLPLLSMPALADPPPYGYPPESSSGGSLFHAILMRILSLLLGAAVGALIGAFLSDRAKRFRLQLILGLLGLVLLLGITVSNAFAFFGAGILAGCSAWLYLRDPDKARGERFEPIFGNAHPATHAEIARAGYMSASDPAEGMRENRAGIPLGNFVEPSNTGDPS